MNAITVYACQWHFPFTDSRDFLFKDLSQVFAKEGTRDFMHFGGLALLQWLFL